MKARLASRPAVLELFERRLAEVLIRSGLNIHDDLRVLGVLWNKFGAETIAPAEQLAPLWKNFCGSAHARGRRLELYLNVPYCAQKCTFCKFPVRIAPKEEAVSDYVDDTTAEMEYFSSAALPLEFHRFAVGGGTPSLLTAAQMGRLLSAATRLFHLRPDAIRSIEFHPASTTPAKLNAARAAGFNRISFGVQSLDRDVLAKMQRAGQTEGHVRQAMRWAHAAGFDHVAAELVVGLIGDSCALFMKSLRALVEERPASISINLLNLTQDYINAEGLDPSRYFAERVQSLSEICAAVEREAPRLGYTAENVSPAKGLWTLRREGAKPRQESCEATDCVLGLGQPSWSQLPGARYQRTRSIFSPARPIYRLHARAPEIEMADYVHYRLMGFSFIDLPSFKKLFDVDFTAQYALELRLLELAGKIELTRTRLNFLPVNLTERFFYGSILFLRQWSNVSAGRALLSPEFLRDLQEKLFRTPVKRAYCRTPSA